MRPTLHKMPFFAAGLATTAISIGVVFWLAQAFEFNIMWYFASFIPIGAIGMGMLATLGYGVSARHLGLRITRHELALLLALGLIAYVIMQYVAYAVAASSLEPMPGFLTYFDTTTRSISFGSEAWGTWGYSVRALEVMGFLGGAWATTDITGNKPHCDACRLYYDERVFGFVPYTDAEDTAHVSSLKEAFEEESHVKITAFVDGERFGRSAPDMPRVLCLMQCCCPRCGQGSFRLDRVHTDDEGNVSRVALQSWHTSTAFNKWLLDTHGKPS